MAKAKASVEARQLPDQISSYGIVSGKARNGKRPFNPNRNKKAWQRYGDDRPRRRSSYSIWDDRW